MGVIDEVLRANEQYVANFTQGDLPTPPARKLAILACMDARLDIYGMLGLKLGDAHIIRNAGGIATDDAVRSLIISHYLLGTQEFLLIHHTGCGMLSFTDDELRDRLQKETGNLAISPERFYSFEHVEGDVKRQILKLRSHPWIPKNIPIRGFVYDVKTGKLNEVKAE